MKYLLRLLLAIGLIYGATKVLFPYYFFHIEHFEYQFLRVSNWVIVPFLSRLSLSAVYIFAFYLILKNNKYPWLKYISVIAICIPFILNPIYPSNFSTNKQTEAIPLIEEIKVDKERVILAFFSSNCLYCKEGSKKLKAAQLNSNYFPKVEVIGVSDKIEDFFEQTNTSFPYQIIEQELFLELTEGSYPKYFLVENQVITKKYSPELLNYKALQELSKKN